MGTSPEQEIDERVKRIMRDLGWEERRPPHPSSRGSRKATDKMFFHNADGKRLDVTFPSRQKTPEDSASIKVLLNRNTEQSWETVEDFEDEIADWVSSNLDAQDGLG